MNTHPAIKPSQKWAHISGEASDETIMCLANLHPNITMPAMVVTMNEQGYIIATPLGDFLKYMIDVTEDIIS